MGENKCNDLIFCPSFKHKTVLSSRIQLNDEGRSLEVFGKPEFILSEQAKC